ncbi:hypothetical protein GCM10023334_002390 [Nonomuraea thailandensis]
MISAMRGPPFRAALGAIAPILVYDTVVTNAADLARYAAVTVPVLGVAGRAGPELPRTTSG